MGTDYEDRAIVRTKREAPAPADDPHPLAQLHQTAGNRAVAQMLSAQREAGAAVAEDESAPSVHDVVGRGGGQPLDDSTRADMETSLGQDFSDVRVHTGGQADASAKAINAHAYTVGNEVVFSEGHYSPGSGDGRKTLAHELTHVVQQRSGPVEGTDVGGGVAVSDPSDRFEQAAEESAAKVAAGERAAPTDHAPSGSAASAQRDAAPEEGDEEPVQGKWAQREAAPEEETEEIAQTLPAQRDAAPEEEGEEEVAQGMWAQREAALEEESEEAPA